MMHTELTADEEIRRIRGLATARKAPSVVGEEHRETPCPWNTSWNRPRGAVWRRRWPAGMSRRPPRRSRRRRPESEPGSPLWAAASAARRDTW